MKILLSSATKFVALVFASGVAMALAANSAHSQTFESNMNAFETPLGMNNITEIDNPSGTRRDQRFNLLETQEPGWRFAVTSVGNLINVETNGSNNSIVINATQINNGNQDATFQSNEGVNSALGQ